MDTPRTQRRSMRTISTNSPHKQITRPRRSNVYRPKRYVLDDSDTSIDESPIRRTTRTIKSSYTPESDVFSDDERVTKTPIKQKTPRKVNRAAEKCETPRTKKRITDLSTALDDLRVLSPRKTPYPLNLGTPTRSILKGSGRKTNIKRVSLAPEFMRRDTEITTERTGLEKARRELHVSAVPSSLPCRENEYSDIYNFLYGKLSGNSSGCMYVAGVPGTGKTATVTEVIKNLQEQTCIDTYDLPEFEFININGMRLTEPRQVYVQILKQLTGETLVWDQAYEVLKKRISVNSAKKKPIILLVDELDVMYTKRQDVVYNILDWPTKVNSKLIIIAISNTMDLPERLLMGRVASRLGLTRLPFQPYTFKQLQLIVLSRLQGTNTFNDEAVQLVARKVAAVSGDARRALDICRRAAEIVALTEEAGTKVSLKHVNSALSEMINSDQIVLIKSLTSIEKLFLQAILAEITRTGVEETSYQNVLKQFKTLCVLENIAQPSYTILCRITQYLAKQKMIIVEKSKFHTINQLFLNLNQDDLHFALNQIE